MRVALAHAVDQHHLQQSDLGLISEMRKVSERRNDLLQPTILDERRYVVGVVSMCVRLLSQRVREHERLFVADRLVQK